MKRIFRIGERVHEVEVERLGEGHYRLTRDGQAVEFAAVRTGDGRVRVERGGEREEFALTRGNREIFVSSAARDARVRIETARRRPAGHDPHASGEISLPMPGRVVKVFVAEGEAVAKGQPLLVVEAMKMEHTMKAPRDGSVSRLKARQGEMVEAGEILLALDGETSVARGEDFPRRPVKNRQPDDEAYE